MILTSSTNEKCDPKVGCSISAVYCCDHNACTADSCKTDIGCVNELISCDDEEACTLNNCDEESGFTNDQISYVDDNHYTHDWCYSDTCCVHDEIKCVTTMNALKMTNVDCDDGCNDKNECTIDERVSSTGCQHLATIQ